MERQERPYRPGTIRLAGDVEVDGRTFRGNMRLVIWLDGEWIHLRFPDEEAPHYCLPIHAVAGIHWED